LTVTSPDYSTARSAYLKAVSAYQLADKNYERSKDLLEHKAIAERDLQQAESDRAQALADQEAAADGLRALGIHDPQALVKEPPKNTGQIPVAAPVGGQITELLVGPGPSVSTPNRWSIAKSTGRAAGLFQFGMCLTK
jgi:cobalt-zinc-cadmium efflux system membrane fusion protein